MHLNELKALHVSEVLKQAEALEIENVGRMRKQELMFAIIKKRAKAGEQVFADDSARAARSSRVSTSSIGTPAVPAGSPSSTSTTAAALATAPRIAGVSTASGASSMLMIV